jgi:formiminoglutamase
VLRNHGRGGAAEGPTAIRRALAGLAWHALQPVWDAGDVVCEGDGLEAAQSELGNAVAELLAAKQFPVLLGGRHEMAYGSFRGLASYAQTSVARTRPIRFGVVNIDAHFDLRTGPQATSGTPFRQIAVDCEASGWSFSYLCLGLDESSNTAALFDTAERLGAIWRSDRELALHRLDGIREQVAAFAANQDFIQLSIDLDALPAAVAPGVSAPAARGVTLEAVETLLDDLLATGRVALVEIAECCPRLDRDGMTAKVAARLAARAARG